MQSPPPVERHGGGLINTPHGQIDTPAFMPVGTRAALKGVAPAQAAETGTQILLANTYHLILRPGAAAVAALGGLQKFMSWNKPVLTDSGGFQVFSLAELRKVDDQGVEFRSHIDGALLHLSPESSIAAQNALGADIIMAFDECPPLPAEPVALRAAVRRTVAWAARSRQAHQRPDQALYGIVQGGLDVALRRECLEQLVRIGFAGYALGGLSVGEPPAEMWQLLHEFADELPIDQPRYLMGVGTPPRPGRGPCRPAWTSLTACCRPAMAARGMCFPAWEWCAYAMRAIAWQTNRWTRRAPATLAPISHGRTCGI